MSGIEGTKRVGDEGTSIAALAAMAAMEAGARLVAAQRPDATIEIEPPLPPEGPIVTALRTEQALGAVIRAVAAGAGAARRGAAARGGMGGRPCGEGDGHRARLARKGDILTEVNLFFA